MSPYSIVNFSCPRCRKLISVQSKADGGCSYYRSTETPREIAENIQGKGAECPHGCGRFIIVRNLQPETVDLTLV